MPIKVRCEGCQTVLNVSDQAAGKAVKCKQCGGRVRVPADGATATSKPKSRPRPAAVPESDDPEDLLSGLELHRAEDTKRKVCPGCATPVREEDIECPKCGVNIMTGSLSERQRRRVERKGPPPEEFYGDLWGNAWTFLKKHWTYAVRTAVVWSITLSLSMTCLFSLNYYVTNRTIALRAMVAAGGEYIKIEGDKVIITTPKEKGGAAVQYDGTFYTIKGARIVLWAPHIAPWKEPPSLFWLGMTLVFQLGFGGWAWTMATTIAGATMAGEKKIKRFQTDFFGNLTMGFRFYVWPTVLTLPLLMIAGAIAPFSPLAAGIVGGSLQLIPLLVLPAAVVHMAQKYSYRSWLLTWMLRDFGKTVTASLYIFAMNLFLVLLVPISVAIAGAVMRTRLTSWLVGQEEAILAWLSATVGNVGEGNVRFLFYQMPLVFSALFVFFFIICGLMSFPAIFMMRVMGLYGVYFRADLAIVNEFPDFEPAGFGPRYLAYMIDNIIMLLLAGVGFFIGQLFGLLFHYYGWSFADMAALGVGAVATLSIWGFYFASGEAGAARATLGKWSMGIIVLKDDNKPQSRKEAFRRAASAAVTAITLYIGFLMCYFRPDKKAMHDLMTKTKVVWQGEQT